MVFQLHPQGYHFAGGHVAKLELLPSDMPYGRFSNLQTNATVSDLELRLPVTEGPGSLGGLVQKPAPKVVPPGYQLAAEYQEKAPQPGGGGEKPSPQPAPVAKVAAAGVAGRLTANRKAVLVPLRCTGEGACSGRITVWSKRRGKKGRVVMARGGYRLRAGTMANARVPLTRSGGKLVKRTLRAHRRQAIPGVLRLRDSGRPQPVTLKRSVHLPRAHRAAHKARTHHAAQKSRGH
jgi:hypothetical protein